MYYFSALFLLCDLSLLDIMIFGGLFGFLALKLPLYIVD